MHPLRERLLHRLNLSFRIKESHFVYFEKFIFNNRRLSFAGAIIDVKEDYFNTRIYNKYLELLYEYNCPVEIYLDPGFEASDLNSLTTYVVNKNDIEKFNN